LNQLFPWHVAITKIRDLFLSDRLARSKTNGAGYSGPRLVRPQPPAAPTYDELLAERNRLIAEERAAEDRLLRLRGQLDQVSTELLAGARSPIERTVAERVTAFLEVMLPQYATWPSADAKAFLPASRTRFLTTV
jgi:hypothetical protein